jgi:hypothetical protein
METAHILGDGWMQFVVDVIVEIHRHICLIQEEELGASAKRHGKPAVKPRPSAGLICNGSEEKFTVWA